MTIALYFDVVNFRLTTPLGGTADKFPMLTYQQEEIVFEIHFVKLVNEVVTAVSVDDSETWSAAFDTVIDPDADPMCRILDTDIDDSGSSSGVISVTIDCDTETFRDRIGTSRYIAGLFCLKGFDSQNKMINFALFDCFAGNIIDPEDGVPLPIPEKYYPAVIRNGTTVPDDSLGNNGDYYILFGLEFETPIYYKSSGTYTIVGDLQGQIGVTPPEIISAEFSGNDMVFGKNKGAPSITIVDAKLTLKGDQGDQGVQGLTGASITSAEFVSDDMVFTKDDATTVTIVGAKTTLKGDQGDQGIQGLTGSSITSGAFVADDLVFTKDDMSTVTITNAKIDLKGETGSTGASITSGEFVSNDLVFTKDDSSTVTITDAKLTLKGDQGDPGLDGAKNNYRADGVTPQSTDDETQGYSVGSIWVTYFSSIPSRYQYICTDATTGSAVWERCNYTALLGLEDFPYSYSGQAGKALTVNSGESAMEFTALLKHNLTAGVNPTTSDDSSQGYSAGSTWYNTVGNAIFICQDATESSAIWSLTSTTASASPTVSGGNIINVNTMFLQTTDGQMMYGDGSGSWVSIGVSPLASWTDTAGKFLRVNSGPNGIETVSALDSGFVLADQSTPQTIGDTTNRLSALWATDITVTNAIDGSVTGNAGTVTNATLTTALTVDTGTVTISGNADNTSALTIGSGAVSVSGSNSGDQPSTSEEITGAQTKATPIDADEFGYVDTEDSSILKKFTWGNIKSVLKTYFDTYLLGKKTYNGFVDRTATLSINGANCKITGAHTIWSDGVKYEKTTDELATSGYGENYFYYSTSGVLSVANSPWDIVSDNVPMSIIYKTPAGRYYMSEERHSHDRNRKDHRWAHLTIGTRWETGFELTSTPGVTPTFSIARGTIHDEDIPIDTGGALTTCVLWYRDSGNAYMETVAGTSTYLAYITGGNVQYDNGSGYTSLGVNKFVCNYVYATNDITNPIYVVIGQNEHNTIANARSELPPVFQGMATREWKLIHRVIWKNAGGGTYEESADYRNVSSIPGGGTTSQTASSTTFAPTGNISAINVQSAIEELDTEKQPLIHGASGKTTPVDADELGLINSASSFATNVLTWANLKATLKTYFDGLYPSITPTTIAELRTGTDNAKIITAGSLRGAGLGSVFGNGSIYANNSIYGKTCFGNYIYTGDATARDVVTKTGTAGNGAEFVPHFAWCKSATAVQGIMWTALGMSKGSAVANTLQNFVGINAGNNGFRIGVTAGCNTNLAAYQWGAFGATNKVSHNGCKMAYGSYTRATASGKAWSGVGFAPDAVFIKGRAATYYPMVWKSKNHSGTISGNFLLNTADGASGGIESLDADGFTIGTDRAVCYTGITFDWIAVKNDTDGDSDIAITKYVGMVGDGVLIPLPFQADIAFLIPAGALGILWWTAGMTAGESAYVSSATASITDGIQGASPYGLKLGSGTEVNTIQNPGVVVAFKSDGGAKTLA